MTAIKEWLMALVAASFLVSVARGLMPRGGPARAGELAAGLVLFLALVSPLLKVRYEDLSRRAEALAGDLHRAAEEVEGETKALQALFIDGETEAYILSRTQALGLDCQVEIRWQEGEVPLPQGATVRGSLTGQERELLAGTLSEELGIPREEITWEEEMP